MKIHMAPAHYRAGQYRGSHLVVANYRANALRYYYRQMRNGGMTPFAARTVVCSLLQTDCQSVYVKDGVETLRHPARFYA